MFTPPPAPYASAHTRAQIVKVLLIIGAVLDVLSILITAASFAFPTLTGDEEPGDNPGGLAVALATLAVAIPTFIIYFATVVCFLMWLHRSASNLPAFGVPRNSL